jgi:hypothetical protein
MKVTSNSIMKYLQNIFLTLWRHHPWCILIWIVSIAINIGYILCIPSISLGGDTHQYIEISDALLCRLNGNFYYYRGWGYPVFLVLTGFPWHHDPFIIAYVQAFLGSFVPVFVYFSMFNLQVRSWIAVIFSIISVLSLSSTILSHAILTDQLSIFLFYLMIYLLTIVISIESSSKYFRISCCMFVCNLIMLYWVRQANSLLCFAVLSTLLIVAGKIRKRVFFISVTFIVVLIVSLFLQSVWVSIAERSTGSKYADSSGSLAGVMLFWNVYGSGSAFADVPVNSPPGRPVVNLENGSCSARLVNILMENLHLVAPVSVDTVLANRTLLNHYYIWKSLELQLGNYEVNKLLLCVAKEALNKHPRVLIYIWDGIVSFFLTSDVIYNDGYRKAWPSFEFYTSIPFFACAWGLSVGTLIKIVSTIIVLLTLLMNWMAGVRRHIISSVTAVSVVYIVFVHVLFAAPHWRYSLTIIPALVFMAGCGLDSFLVVSGRIKSNPSLATPGYRAG